MFRMDAQRLAKHVVNFGEIDDAELVAQHRRNMHLRKGAGRHGYAILAGDFPRFHESRLPAAEQHNGVVLAALTGFTDDRQACCRHLRKLLAGLDRPIPVGRNRAAVKIPLDIFQQRPDVEVIHPQTLLVGQDSGVILVRKPAVVGQLKRLYEQEPEFLFFCRQERFPPVVRKNRIKAILP